jgi:hypothetical protein
MPLDAFERIAIALMIATIVGVALVIATMVPL